MANAIIYFRTPTTRIADEADPQNLPAAQKLEFTFPDNIMEGINEVYKNNIKQIPIPNQDGTRKLNIQENGLLQSMFTVNGVFKKTPTDFDKLKSFRRQKQVDTHHLFGAFGIEIDNAPEFNIDPSNTVGLFIDGTNVGYAGIRSTRYDFQVTFGLGGTVPAVVIT